MNVVEFLKYILYNIVLYFQYEIAIRGAEKLTAVHGTPYQVGTSADILCT